MKFNKYDIEESIKKRINEMGYKKPTDIQYKTIPYVLNGEDVLAIAQTGTGKTAAYVIPLLHRIMNQKLRKKIAVCILVPTRELAVQIKEVFNDIGCYTDVKTYAIFGGVEQENQIQRIDARIDVLIATPGRLFDLIHQGVVDLSSLKTLVVDEADHMLGKGFVKDVLDLERHLPSRRQTLFFSATIDKDIKKLAYAIVRNAIRIQLSPKDPVSKNIEHFYIKMSMDDKRHYLAELIHDYEDEKIIVFVRTKVRAERLTSALARVNINCLTLHGDVEQKNRLQIIKQFKEGTERILVATDVSARGIDIPNVDVVVNYDLPDEAENYVHRIGRSGRGTNKGLAYAFVAPEELEKLEAIESFINKSIKEVKFTKKLKESIVQTQIEGELSMDKIAEMLRANDLNEIKKSKKRKK